MRKQQTGSKANDNKQDRTGKTAKAANKTSKQTNKKGKTYRDEAKAIVLARKEQTEFYEQQANEEQNTGRNSSWFKPGNTAATIWTEETVCIKLEEIYELLVQHPKTKKQAEDIVFANSIKLVSHACLRVGITKRVFQHWQNVFCRETNVRVVKEMNESTGNEENKVIEDPNPSFSVSVLCLIEQIKEICEARLVYSGGNADIFVLKNHYGMTDRVDVTSNKNELTAQTGTEPPKAVMPKIVTIREKAKYSERHETGATPDDKFNL